MTLQHLPYWMHHDPHTYLCMLFCQSRVLAQVSFHEEEIIVYGYVVIAEPEKALLKCEHR